MFVQATPDGGLKKEIQRSADNNKVSFKIIEKVENSVRKELQRSNPFKDQKCGREKCIICKLESGVNCRARGCIYELICAECERRYRGQTGNSSGDESDSILVTGNTNLRHALCTGTPNYTITAKNFRYESRS